MYQKLIICFVLLFFANACFYRQASTYLDDLRNKTQKQLLWPSGHRADPYCHPENSLEAIKSAIDYGIPLIEIDLRSSSDHKIYLFHDKRLHANKIIAEKKLYEKYFSKLDSRQIAELAYLSGAKIASFENVLDLTKNSRSILQLDIKSADENFYQQIISTIFKYNAADRIIIQCQVYECIKMLRENYPKLALLARTRSVAEVERAFAYKPEIIQVDQEWADRNLIAKIRAHNIAILTKTLEEKDQEKVWQENFDFGYDILLTDYPAKILEKYNHEMIIRHDRACLKNLN